MRSTGTRCSSRRGWWRHRRRYRPARKIQSIDLAESFWSRLFGICTLRLGVAGGSGFSDHHVPALTRAEAEALRAELLVMSPFACGVEQSLLGQPWRWRRSGGDELGRDLVDQLLLARGVEEIDLARHRAPTIRDFLPDPSAFRDMDKAAARLADAVEAGETIAIFGDYDVDGATSAALLTILLRRLGVEPMVYIPDRLMEGYGPSGAALVELKRRGASLAVTVDCGAQAFDALQEAADAGLDVIVCDHHQCATSLPVAHALINPNRLDESEIGAAHGHVAAVGMAFLLGVALLRELRSRGRFADGPNRRSSTCSTSSRSAPWPMSPGSRRSTAPSSPRASRSWPSGATSASPRWPRRRGWSKPPTCRDLGFALGPRINAGGRVGKSDLGVRLLTSTDPEEARTIAAELDRLNEERRAIEMLVTEQATAWREAQDERAR